MMRGLIGATGVVMMAALAAFPVMAAKRDKRPPDAICDPLLQSSRQSTSPAGLLIGGFDTNADARVDRTELKAGTDRMFRLADDNRDGALSLIELSQWAATWLGGPSAIPGRFDFDRDQDDRISPAEFAAELTRRFDAFDRNKDNLVDRGELLTGAVPRNCVDGRLVPPSPGQPEPR